MTGYQWQPIEDLPEDWRETLASSELAGLFGVWKERVVELKDSPAYQEFMTRLRREWAIETGIIEGLYDIDRGVTRTLIERGLHASLIAHGDANKPASQIIPILNDHEMVVEGLFDFVGQQRELSTSYIKQVHQALTTHQETAEGRDQQGRVTEIPLLRGDWKKWPNNPTRPDGKVHEYCPPEQVASEMDRLIAMHEQHLRDGVPPEVEATWLHHRFTQIHPFQDGNGRVARALASLVFIRAEWFPFVVHRDERPDYIACLETADVGDLTKLVELVGRFQKKAVNQAINLSHVVLLPENTVEQIITAGGRTLKEKELAEKLRIKNRWDRFNAYKQYAVTLQDITAKRLDEIVNSLRGVVTEMRLSQSPQFERQQWGFGKTSIALYETGGAAVGKILSVKPDTNEDGWGHTLIIEERWLNFCCYVVQNTDYKLVCCLAYSYSNKTDFQLLNDDAFQCSVDEDVNQVMTRYRGWLERALITGFEEWRKTL